MHEITLKGRGPNTMSLALLDDVRREIEAAAEGPLLITGAGDAFSAGLDLDELQKGDAAAVEQWLESMERVVRKMFLHPGPTVALVNGHAVAGGCLLVQCCDVRVGIDDPRIRIGMTGVSIGLTYPPFVTAVFRHRVPVPHYETVLLGAQRYAPEQALRLGLLDELATRDQAREIAVARLEARARLQPHAYASTKRALRTPAFARLDEDRKLFAKEVLPTWTGKLAR